MYINAAGPSDAVLWYSTVVGAWQQYKQQMLSDTYHIE